MGNINLKLFFTPVRVSSYRHKVRFILSGFIMLLNHLVVGTLLVMSFLAWFQLIVLCIGVVVRAYHGLYLELHLEYLLGVLQIRLPLFQHLVEVVYSCLRFFEFYLHLIHFFRLLFLAFHNFHLAIHFLLVQ
jgi:hypothetical protein